MDNISSSVVSQAFKIQLGEGTNLSMEKKSSLLIRTVASLRPKYTTLLLGCFLNIEYKEKSTTHRPILIPAEVKRAAMSICLHWICNHINLIAQVRNSRRRSLKGEAYKHFIIYLMQYIQETETPHSSKYILEEIHAYMIRLLTSKCKPRIANQSNSKLTPKSSILVCI